MTNGTRTLSLGGMHLVSRHGDVDIYMRGESTLIPTVRLQRADMDEIIDFLKRSRKDHD